jgi:hypothetical protein
MAAPITTQAEHLAQQVAETAYALYEAETLELQKAQPAINQRRVSITPNLQAGTLSIAATLPLETNGNDNGGFCSNVVNYLPTPAGE